MTVVRRSWQTLLLLQVIGVGISVVVLAVPTYLQLSWATGGLGDTYEAQLAALLRAAGLGILAIPLFLVVNALVVLASVYVVVTAAVGGRATVGEALRGAARRVLPLVGWSLLAGLITVVGTCACLLPGLYLGLVFLFLPPVVAFGRRGVFVRCFQIFHTDLGAALGRTLTILGLIIATRIVSWTLDRVLGLSAPPPGAGTGELVVTTVVSVVIPAALGAAVGILTAPLTVVAYADLRARREPLSAAQLAAELAR
jgi:hypothetical protein